MTLYRELPGFKAHEAKRDALGLARSQALYDAVARDRSCKLIGLCGSAVGTARLDEMLIVEVSCDDVPTQNKAGVNYRERVGIVVRADDSSIPEVYPLREGFPLLSHMSDSPPAFPPNLCLYFEPVRSTLRTWTAAKFLKRIQWWLAESARGTLHAADQPVERLFFQARIELVLPYDYEKRRSAGDAFILTSRGARGDGSMTMVGRFLGKQEQVKSDIKSSRLISIELPQTLHGAVEREPATLGELHEKLLHRGFDLKSRLSQQIASSVTAHGTTTKESTTSTTILLSVPLVREAGGTVERVQHRAFILTKDSLKLGEQLGCLVPLEGKYYRDPPLFGAPVVEGNWRGLELLPVEVLCQNDSAVARAQSGISDVGPKGTLIGTGALGSALLNLWARAGWGSWTVVDKDHIKPHNLVRHIATFDQVGMPKSHAMVEYVGAIDVGGFELTGVALDAVESTHEDLLKPIEASVLVVDASTTLDYPRRASMRANWPRHASAFITPSGRDGVLLLEDAGRQRTLRTLEAQYYRAVLSSAWGEHHLDGNMGTFWSGAGCRDISAKLPYSRVYAHAATQAEQVMTLCKHPDAAIRVWARDPATGGVSAHNVPTAAEERYELGNFTGYLDEGLKEKLRQMRAAALPAETGGVLLGYWDFNIGALVLVDALPAPAGSTGTTTSFVRGTDGLLDAVNDAQRRTAGVVGYVGEWHSHPPGHSAKPSSDDLNQLAVLALRMAEDGLPVATLIVGEGEFRVMQGGLA